MLRKCSEMEFEKFSDFMYKVALNLEKSGYPTYCDGVKTKEMFIERSHKAFERDTENILLFENEGLVEGWIHYQWIKEDNYLSTCSFLINKNTELALEEFIEYAKSNFEGYDLYLGYPGENKCAINYLRNANFECIESDYSNIAFLKEIEVSPIDEGIIPITRDNYALFSEIHSQITGEMYWNSERILEDLDNWFIYVLMDNGKPIGTVYYTDEEDDMYELFGIDFPEEKYNEDTFTKLLKACMYDCKARGAKILFFFCEEEAQQAAIDAGFTCVSKYECYFKRM